MFRLGKLSWFISLILNNVYTQSKVTFLDKVAAHPKIRPPPPQLQ